VLALIMGQAELLQMAQKDSHEKEAYSVIITAAQDGAAMINRLREFYRSRKANELREAVNLNDVIKQTVSFTKPKWREQAVGRGIAIRIETELEEVPPIQANATELREMLTNLIFNAVDAMTRDGTITLRTRVKNRQVVLDIADTGAGMSPDVQMRCLEPLFTTKGEKGTGMGLAMVYGTVKRHGGSISLESEPGKGSTFHLYFPCESASPREKVEDALPEKMDGVLRILAIDRELVLLEILAKRLQRDGHQVTAASSAREALKKVRPGLFDLVIANQAMPELTGQEIAVAIKKLDPKIRVVLMTEFRDEESELQQIDSVDFFIGKPVTLATLRQALWHCFKPKML